MKKIMMTLAAVAVAATMNAQVYVGGTLGFKSISQDGNSATAFTINPEVGYNLDENWAVGIDLGYSTSNIALEDGIFDGKLDKSVNTFSINPYARYTFVKLDKVNFFFDGIVSYAHTDAGVKYNTFGINFQPGVAVNLNDNISFVAKLGQIGYTTSKADTDGAKAVNEFDFTLNSLAALNFGLYFNF